MQDFSKFNKKEESVNLPPADFEIGKKIRLVANLSVYEPGEVFTVVNESTPTFSTSTWGIGETYLKDNNGSVLLIKGNKKFINEVFENVQEPPIEIVEEKKEDTIPFLVEDLKKSLKEELVKQLKEEIKPLPGLKGDKGDRGMPGMPGDKGDKGDVGERGETGWTGWPGDKGEQGVQGEKGEKGDKGDQGERGEKGDRGEPGPQGDKGEKGDAGDKGEKGDKGERGDRGDVGQQGERGEKGDQGEKGDKGDQGEPGLSGRDGKDGAAGEKGEKGDKGNTGERGEKGDKGETGESGIVSVSYPLAYEDVTKHLSLDTKYLEEFNNKVTSEISKHAYGSSGGGNVDLYIEGEKAVKNLRSINFTGDGVTVTPDGIKATVNITGGEGPQGPQGPQGPPGPPGSGSPGNNDVGVMYLKNNTTETSITAINQRKVVQGTIETGTLFNFIKDPSSNSLKYTGPGARFHVIATFNFITGSQDICGFYIGKNTNPLGSLDPDADRISESEIYINSAGSSAQPVAGAIQTVLDLETDDRVFFIVQNKDAAKNITVQFLKFTVTSLTAEKGDPGVDVDNAFIDTDGDLILQLSDNTSINVGNIVGEDGAVGATGATGATGVGVSNADINTNGDLIIALTNSTTINAGNVIGPTGLTGPAGPAGTPASNSRGWFFL